MLGFSLFPDADIPQFRITVETPTGASLADTDRALQFVEAELASHREVKHYFANLGHGNPRVYYNIFPEETNANVGEVFAEFDRYDPQAQPRAARRDACHARAVSRRAHPGRELPQRPTDRRAHRARDQRPGPRATAAAREPGRDHHRGNARHARRRQPDAPPAHRPRPAHRHRQGRSARRSAGRSGPHGASGRGRPQRRQFREADGDEFDITVRLPMSGRQTLDALDRIEVASATRPVRAVAAARRRRSFRRHPAASSATIVLREVVITAYTTTRRTSRR